MQNVVQNSAAESVGNCVKHEVVGHRAIPATPTSSTCAKPVKSHCNSVPKSNHNSNKGSSYPNLSQPPHLNHKTVAPSDKALSLNTLATETAIQQVKQSRSYQYMPDSSDSDSDDVLSVSLIWWSYQVLNHLMILDLFLQRVGCSPLPPPHQITHCGLFSFLMVHYFKQIISSNQKLWKG